LFSGLLAPERLRDWEWHHLAGRVDQALWSVQFPPREQVYGLDFSPDGDRLLVAAGSLAAAIDIPERKFLWSVQTHAEGACWRVRVLPDGGGIFVRLEQQIERLDATGAVVTIAADPGIHGIALDRARSRLFTDADDGFRVRDPTTLALRRSVKADPPLAGAASTILLTPDESRVVLGDASGGITAIEVESGATAWTARIPGSDAEIRGLATSPDGTRLAAVAFGHVVLIDTRDGAIVWHRNVAARSLFSPNFTPDGRELLVATWQETIDRLAVEDGRTTGSVSGIFSQVWTTAVSPDGRTFAASGLSGRVAIFPIDATSDPSSVSLDGSPVESIALGRGSTAGLAFATTAAGSLWRMDARTVAATRLDPGLEARGVAVGPDGQCAVAHSRGVAWIAPDGRILEDITLPEPIIRVSLLDERHAFAVCDTSGLVDRAFIVRRGGDDAGATLWELQPRGFDCGFACPTGSPGEFFIPSGHSGVAMTVRVSDPDGRRLESPLISPLIDQPEYPLTAAISPDGSTLALGCVMSNGEVTLSDPRTFRQRLNFPNHRGKVRSLAWSPDGKRLASAGMDDTVRIWHVERGGEILVAWRGAANGLAWDEDGTLWIAGGDGRIRLLRSSVPSAKPSPTIQARPTACVPQPRLFPPRFASTPS
jgi:WD40 repeat protein